MMRQQIFLIEEILEEAAFRIDYIAGKRATNEKEFFRLHICESDGEILKRLAADALAWMGAQCSWLHCAVDDGEIIMAADDSYRVMENRLLLKRLLTSRICHLWAGITAVAETDSSRDGSDRIMEALREPSRNLGPLRDRPYPRF